MNLFYEIPDYPELVSGTSVLVRLIDGLGFRFHWSTEGLRDKDYTFRPAHDCMSIEELVRHIWRLVNRVCQSMKLNEVQEEDDIYLVRKRILEMTNALRVKLLSMSDEELAAIQIRELPFWYIVNGPIADALTHVGQINSFRRLAGNPTMKASMFRGLPPKD